MFSDVRGPEAPDEGDPRASDRKTDHNDFLAFVGDYRKPWSPDGTSIIFEWDEERRYSVTVALVDGRFPRITFHLEKLSHSVARELFNWLAQTHNGLDEKTGASMRLKYPNRTVTFISKRPVLWPAGAGSGREYAPTWVEAKRWIDETVNMLGVHIRSVVDAKRQPSPPLLKAAPVKKAVAKKVAAPPRPAKARVDRVGPQMASSTTPVAPATAPPSQPKSEISEGIRHRRPALPTMEPARERPQQSCPVCEKPVQNGLIRHQQCENRRRETGNEGSTVPPPATADTATYRALVSKVEQREAAAYGQRRETKRNAPVRLGDAKDAVLLRSRGRCENPSCAGQVDDVTDDGQPILEVDHIERISEGGRDHPVQMIALCPNCHAKKERGSHRAELRTLLLESARTAHELWQGGSMVN
ncbi:HNH endonuclease [Kitasatospora sp. NPDC048296]|uniref:HNH endonuclease n=1 Tax=Kitasatospora sp. NPDC048296 TaxID=3364048 RepID=UPI00371F2F7C